MSEEKETEAKAKREERQFAIQRIYTKDISLESPISPAVFTEDWKPEINVNLNTGVQELGNNNYELVLTVTITAKQGDKTAFLVEVHQAGIFMIAGVPKEEMGPMLGIYCANILFPYVREAVADLITRASFPQFILSPVNFEAIYAQQTSKPAETTH